MITPAIAQALTILANSRVCWLLRGSACRAPRRYQPAGRSPLI